MALREVACNALEVKAGGERRAGEVKSTSAEVGPSCTHSSGSETYISLVRVLLTSKQELGDMCDARLISARTEDQDFSSS